MCKLKKYLGVLVKVQTLTIEGSLLSDTHTVGNRETTMKTVNPDKAKERF